jgi:asparagine synthetase B (glutamine-hydrolysing)
VAGTEPEREARPSQLSPLELAIGMPLGVEGVPRAPDSPTARGESPATALSEAMLPVLANPPALVAFSGGRDSSLLLAVAVDAARRHGLPLPVPVTYRSAAAPATDESEWQELIIAHMGIDDWVRIPGADELDFLGPIAREALLRHGVRYPPNAHFVSRLAPHARGGTLVLGIGGDELFAAWRWTGRANVLAGRTRLDRRHLGTVLLGSAPALLRREVIRRRERPLAVPWITPQARALLSGTVSDAEAQPTRWDHFVRGAVRRRTLTVALRTLSSLAEDAGARLSVPLVDARFLAALAGAAGRHGWSSRTAAVQAIAGDLLPPAATQRRTKAWFNEVYWGQQSRRFARAWDGVLGCPDLVDRDALRREWLKANPHAHAAVLLQARWLAQASGRTPA